MPTLDDIRSAAATLPGSEERARTGGAAWFVRSRLFAWECHPWPSIPADIREIIARESVAAVKVGEEIEALALAAEWPDVFLRTTTRWSEPKIAFRLARIDPQLLVEIVTEGWYSQAPASLRRAFDESAAI